MVAALVSAPSCNSSEGDEAVSFPAQVSDCGDADELCAKAVELIADARDGDEIVRRSDSLEIQRVSHYKEIVAVDGLTPEITAAATSSRCVAECATLLWWMDGGYPEGVELVGDSKLGWTDAAHVVAFDASGRPLWHVSGDVCLLAPLSTADPAALSNDPSLLRVPTAAMRFSRQN